MKKTTLIAAIALIMSLNSCKKSEKTAEKFAELAKAEWLLGTWENRSGDGVLSETWEKEDDSTFTGTSYFIIGKDTLHNEKITLSQKGKLLVYSPIVQGQNNNKAVNFTMTSLKANQIVFENPVHDYPQKITYNRITNDSLVTEISGIQQGKHSADRYPMKRK